MDIETLRNYCLAKAETTEGFPFGPDTIVFKVEGKIYLLAGLDEYPLQFNVKCDPEEAIRLRDKYPNSVLPGYHMNKKHWNTIVCTGEIPIPKLLAMVDESYRLVTKNIPKKR
jgi:predicted DNA-binding protein (MmcQ/YjbR family)